MNSEVAENRAPSQNLYCSHCLRTRPFSATERGYRCPVCAKNLVVTDPPVFMEDLARFAIPDSTASG